MAAPQPLDHQSSQPPDAAPGSCWEKDETPAVIETVTEQIIVQPPEIDSNGAVLNPAVFRTETRQAIVSPRREIWLETVCAQAFTPEFTATLQRSLAARDHYHGPITGILDVATQRAIRSFQASQGLDSSRLSLDAARKMGLVAIARQTEE